MDNLNPPKLVEPPTLSRTEQAASVCKEIIREGIIDSRAVNEGGSVRRPSFKGEEYDEGYVQGRKDAARAILISLGILDLGATSDNPDGDWEDDRNG